MSKELFTTKEASEALGYASDGTLYHLVKQGKLKFVKQPSPTGGRDRNMVTYEDIERLMAQRKSPAKKAEPTPAAEPVDTDPVLDALKELERGIRRVRQALRAHDSKVRRDTVASIADSLKDGLAK